MKLRHYIIALFFSASSALHAQDADSLLLGDELDFLLSDDTTSIFKLIDSLLNTKALTPSSQLALRVGYNSNVMAAGRTLGIENFGLSPGIGYYHKSGLYADVSGFWSKDFEPSYYLTIGSLGYSRVFNKYFSLIASYDRYFYNVQGDDSFISYKNAFTISPMLDYKILNLNITYAYFFGDKNAHRLMPSVGLTLEKKNVWGLKRIAALPSFIVLVGNETFTETEIRYPQTLREALQNVQNYGTRYAIITTTRQESGIMNYAFNLPVSITYKDFNFIFSYSYSIPKALPSETLNFSESSYLSASLTYLLDLRPHKKAWQ